MVLPYLKLLFGQRSYYVVSLYQDFSGSWQFYLECCRTSHCGSKHNSGPTVCLNQTVAQKHINKKELYLNMSKYIYKLLAVKSLNHTFVHWINITHYSWIITYVSWNIRHYGWYTILRTSTEILHISAEILRTPADIQYYTLQVIYNIIHFSINIAQFG